MNISHITSIISSQPAPILGQNDLKDDLRGLKPSNPLAQKEAVIPQEPLLTRAKTIAEVGKEVALLQEKLKITQTDLLGVKKRLNKLEGRDAAKGSWFGGLIIAFNCWWNAKEIDEIAKKEFNPLKEKENDLMKDRDKMFDALRLDSHSDLDNRPYVLNQLLSVASKGEDEAARVSNSFEGLRSEFHIPFRARVAQKLLKKAHAENIPGVNTESEIQGLYRIFQHRNHLASYVKKMGEVNTHLENGLDAQKDPDLVRAEGLAKMKDLVNGIGRNIEELDKSKHPDSNVTMLPDGTTTFSIPGGWPGHYVTYEFRREPEPHPTGTYYFVVHNRGERFTDPRLHGSINFRDDTKTYRKTSVKIKVSLEALKNEAFLSSLIEDKIRINEKCNNEKNNTNFEAPPFSYEAIYYYLIKQAEGTIVVSEKEKRLEELFILSKQALISGNKALTNEITALAMTIVDEEPSFHSIQKFGTCVESNLTAVEKEMAPKSVLKALKAFTIEELTTEVVQQRHLPSSPLKAKEGGPNQLAKSLHRKTTSEFLATNRLIQKITAWSSLKLKSLNKKIATQEGLKKKEKTSKEKPHVDIQAKIMTWQENLNGKIPHANLAREYSITLKIIADYGRSCAALRFEGTNITTQLSIDTTYISFLKQRAALLLKSIPKDGSRVMESNALQVEEFVKRLDRLVEAEQCEPKGMAPVEIQKKIMELRGFSLDKTGNEKEMTAIVEEIQEMLKSIPAGGLFWTCIRNEFKELLEKKLSTLPDDNKLKQKTLEIIQTANDQGALVSSPVK